MLYQTASVNFVIIAQGVRPVGRLYSKFFFQNLVIFAVILGPVAPIEWNFKFYQISNFAKFHFIGAGRKTSKSPFD